MKFRIKEKRIGGLCNMNNVIDAFFAETGFERERNIDKLKREWGSIVGNNLSVHSVPIMISENILIIYTDHSVFSNDLVLMKNSIMLKANEVLNGSKINDMKVEVKKLKWERGGG